MARAIGMVELTTVSTGFKAADDMSKAADVDILQAEVTCPGKFVVLIAGDLSAVRASVDSVKGRYGTAIYTKIEPLDVEKETPVYAKYSASNLRTALANGGVVNDHHGVGIKLGRLMKEQYGPAMQVFEGIKKQLDPNGIMNPFKLGL